MDEPIEIGSDSFRVDFKVKLLGTQPDGLMEMAFVPDPERYEWLDDKEHGRVLYDLKTRTMIPEAVMEELAEQVAGTPIYAPPAGIPDPSELFALRRQVIEAALAKKSTRKNSAAPPPTSLLRRSGRGRRSQSSLSTWSALPVCRQGSQRPMAVSTKSSCVR